MSRIRCSLARATDEYIREGWLKSLAGATLDSFRIGNKDSIHAPLSVQAFFSASEHAQAAGDKIYLNPILWGRREENPFKQPERTFPVDFGCATQQSYTLNLTLPEGCVANVQRYSFSDSPQKSTLRSQSPRRFGESKATKPNDFVGRLDAFLVAGRAVVGPGRAHEVVLKRSTTTATTGKP